MPMPDTRPTEILLLTHGGWGMSLVKGIEMILGKVDCVTEIALLPTYTLPEYLGMVREHVDGISPDSLIITDFFGGTPSNVAGVIGNQTGVRAFCGLNAPMLLEACIELQNEGKIDFDQVLTTGQGACNDIVALVRDNMKKNTEKN